MAAEGLQVRARRPCDTCEGRGMLQKGEYGGVRGFDVPCPAGCDGGWAEFWLVVRPALEREGSWQALGIDGPPPEET